MSHHWLLTNTCYGTWLPGDSRGFVGQVRDHRPGDDQIDRRITHNHFGTAYDEDLPELEGASRSLLKGPPISLTAPHANVMLSQFHETARFRNWTLLAVAVMFNHFHIVLRDDSERHPSRILGDLKAYATRGLSRRFGVPASKTWWTERGSKRRLDDDQAIANAVRYVLYNQPKPLVTWSPTIGLHFGQPPINDT